jgi:hypothetical protein
MRNARANFEGHIFRTVDEPTDTSRDRFKQFQGLAAAEEKRRREAPIVITRQRGTKSQPATRNSQPATPECEQ